MNAERLTHADLEPTFKGAGGMSSCCCDDEIGMDMGMGMDMMNDGDLEIIAWEETSRDWRTLGLTFALGLIAGGLLTAYRRPITGFLNSGTRSATRMFGLGGGHEDGPHSPFDPRTKELNVGVGSLSPQSYRSTEEAMENSEVNEASEESFPASDPPAWTGMSSVGRCGNE